MRGNSVLSFVRMNPFDEALDQRLETLREQGLRRELRRVDSAQGPHIQINGRTFLNFSSNDYLGLANHPAIKEAAINAVGQFGAGAGASRLICGSLRRFTNWRKPSPNLKILNQR